MTEKQRYTPELAVGLQIASDAQVSPDGKQVAFVVAPIGHAETTPTSTIWLADVDGRQPARPFTAGTVEDRMPRWSPDSRTLAFLSDRAERRVAQVHLISAGEVGGEARQLTSVAKGLDQLAWAPDGRSLTATADRRALAGETEPANGIRVFSQSARPRVIVRFSVDDQSGKAEPSVIGPAEGHVVGYAWSADGKHLAALVTPSERLDAAANGVRVVLIDATSHAERELTTLEGTPAAFQWSPDGTRLVAVGDLPGGAPDDDRILLIDAESGEISALEAGETTPGWAGWLPDSRHILSLAQEGLYNRIDEVDLASGTSRRLDLLPEGGAPMPPLSLSADGRTLALVRAQTDSPPEVWAGPLAGELRCLTHLNPQLDDVEISPMEPIEWRSSDGLTIQGWLILPPGMSASAATPGARLPLVVKVHGGPTARYGPSFNATWHDWGQVLAAAGYAVLLPNPRGSTGRGQAFTAANRNDLGGMDFDDVMTGVDHLIDQGIVDPERLGIGGWSYGGFMTAWAVTQTDRFKAAVAGAAVTNWPSKVGTTDIRPFNEKRFPGPLHETPDAFWERSPVRYLGRITTPTLVVHGDADQRVPLGQGTEFFLGLRAMGVPSDFVIYPRQKHAFHERESQLDLLKRILEWYGRWLGVEARE